MKAISLSTILVFSWFVNYKPMIVGPDEKSPYQVIVCNPHVIDGQNNQVENMIFSVLLFNNTNDTLRYVDVYSNMSTIYQIDDENLQIQDGRYGKRGVKRTIIPPHKRTLTIVQVSFKKTPDSVFSFRLGMKLLQWPKTPKQNMPDTNTLLHANMIWSDRTTIIFGRNHYGPEEEQNELKAKYPLIYDTLSNQDRKEYILNIDANKIGKLKDTSVYDNNQKYYFASVPLNLSNNSDDTLKYFSMSCSWEEIYMVGSKDGGLLGWDCLKNIPDEIVVRPHTTRSVNLPIIFNKKSSENKYSFRIGMVLLRNFDIWTMSDYDIAFGDKRYLIWSNEVEIPKP